MYYFAGYALKILLSLFGPLKVFNKEQLLKDRGYVLACTHTSWLDIIFLGIAVLPTKINFMAKKELFAKPFSRWVVESLNAFPVDRENPGPSSIKTPIRLIRKNNVVGIFPSGTRTTEDVPLKRGAVTIATHAKAPIVPAAYAGPLTFKQLFRFRRPKIIFGEPIYLREDLSKNEALEQMAEELDLALKQLKEKIS